MARSTVVRFFLFTTFVGALADPYWGFPDKKENPNWTVDFVKSHGYPIETHPRVNTQDGYLLTLHRIPSKIGKGRPVLLQHGFLGQSADFVVQGPNNSLAFVLADQGYDVWMANSRGSINSREKLTEVTRDQDFWDFSFQEIGYFDIPAEIDYVLKTTGHKNLSFVGFSTGATAFFITGATRPEYHAKVDKMIALGPVGVMENVRSPVLKHIAPLVKDMPLLVGLGDGQFLPTYKFMRWARKTYCGEGMDPHRLCKNGLYLLFGYSNPNLNETVVKRISEYSPSGGSITQYVQLAQLVNAAPSFVKFDHGAERNMRKYGRRTPPEYNLEALSVPVHIFIGGKDGFANRRDVLKLTSDIPKVRSVSVYPFDHYDFLYSENAKDVCYKTLVKILGF